MNLIYLSSSCSEGKFKELFKRGVVRQLPQAQKYHQLLIEGLSKYVKGEIFALSALPTNHKYSNQFKFEREVEVDGNVTYIYEAFKNRPILRQRSLFKNAKKTISKLCKENKDVVIICDVLNYSISKAALNVAKKYSVKTLGIVTDIPGVQKSNLHNLSKFKKIIVKYLDKKKLAQIDKFDSYLLLAEAMNEVINKRNKPYLVIEGHANAEMIKISNDMDKKQMPKVIMYAGSLHVEYGVKLLTEAFLSGEFNGCELHIYGAGNYQEELQRIAKENSSIKYFGVVDNAEIVDRQLKATLMVNPRPTNEDFVKYSFPSKTMEYMASGTPLLTTKIPSMPNEYLEYVYLINDETVEGLRKALLSVLSKSIEELHEKGKSAKHFILEQKNNYIQAKKLIEFIEG